MNKVYFPNHLVVEMLGLSLDVEIVDVDLEGSEVVFTVVEEGSDKA
ncbi:hypothetical protein [Paenibacillus odorifer]|nr:hypothetical protein [Paenibacillus odorifer]